MKTDGGRVLPRDRRVGRLAVVVAVQNVMVAACLAVTLYLCWGASEGNAHIHFDAISDITGNTTLQFELVLSSRMMGLVDKRWISVNCTGPYIIYSELCYNSTEQVKTKPELQLHVQGREAPVSIFPLETSQKVLCTWLRGLTYLMANKDASLRLVSSEGFKIKNVTVGLNYLLGGRCEY